MAIEIVSFPIKNGGSFHSYVTVYQRVTTLGWSLDNAGQPWATLVDPGSTFDPFDLRVICSSRVNGRALEMLFFCTRIFSVQQHLLHPKMLRVNGNCGLLWFYYIKWSLNHCQQTWLRVEILLPATWKKKGTAKYWCLKNSRTILEVNLPNPLLTSQ